MRPLWVLLIVLALTLPLVLTLIYLDLAARVLHLLGLSPLGAVLLLAGSLLGSLINIPITRQRIEIIDPDLAALPGWARRLAPFFYYDPPVVAEQVIAINVGGALVPIGFSIYLLTLPGTAWFAAFLATVIVAVIARFLARPLKGVGVAMPAIISLLVTALVARLLILALGLPVASAAPVAYIAGTIGTLIGADLLNLPRILRGALVADGAGVTPLVNGQVVMASIGGAGIYDGIFLTGIVAPLLAVL